MQAGQFMIPVVEFDPETNKAYVTGHYVESKVHLFVDDLDDYRPLMACGKRPHGTAEPWEMPLDRINCKSCKRTKAFREISGLVPTPDAGEFPPGF